ncbi:MAG: FAD-dependent oxidoreductase [Desulfuromonas sp.]|nr:MAG: FAD-dependent oxidoreductase [Desulfuromonas sp.]
MSKKNILIVGGGFAGIGCAKKLANCAASITLIDRHNYHLFQPLLYQVATAVLSPADIASPIRHIFYKQENVRVGMGELSGVDLEKRIAHFDNVDVKYDYLVLAAGARDEYFGKDEWAQLAPAMKTIDDALDIRRRVLMAYEAAEWEADESARRAKLTFVVVGGGPTGVEMAGALKEIAAKTIPKDFSNIDTTTARVILVEGGGRLLAAMPEKASEQAMRDLEKMGVEVRLNSFVTDISPGMISIGNEKLAVENIIWAAGVRACKFTETLGVELDRAGRVVVNPDLSIPGHPEVFVVGDLAHAFDEKSGRPVPGVAPAAIQMGEYVAELLGREIESGAAEAERKPFRYHDKGSMATIGRNRAVAAIKGRTFSGFPAWLFWGIVHLIPLVGFRRRLSVMFSWAWSYFSFTKNARLITGNIKMKVKRLRRD